MSQPYIGQLKLVGFNFAPSGWAMCQGQSVAISENDTLFNLLGTTYGGDGQNTFNLPQLSGRVPLHSGNDGQGNTYNIGQNGGVESVTITQQQTPIHNHSFLASQSTGTLNSPQSAYLGSGQMIYAQTTPSVPMNSGSLAHQGGSQPHENRQPYLVMTWIISLFGIYPQQN